MLTISDLEEISAARLQDAQVLCAAGRFDGAYYLAGYSVELALKSRICKTLNWMDFPATNKEFERFRSFKVHDLEVLLKLSGLEATVKDKHLAEWGTVKAWQPEVRYRQVGFADEIATAAMLDAVLSLMGEL
ncbi:DNA-binding protein [Duganella dendranthematis]|uniref:DNA-binding protein n=1 Tax=Duganella dendranthematis TaxID=2728021 RepID=A0ABX6MAE8_9BURK|nr:DNA-binding protein [Duganella dendranthematis]QJD91297.1 DNA-binding protein [Duganella dendranthematis]